MTSKRTEEDLFQLGQRCFAAFVQEFASYGMHADPQMELRRGTGMLCYYDRSDGHIYLSLPDSQSPEGKLQLLILRSALSCESDEQLLELFELFLPYAIAHELGHHYRHRYGLFSDDRWYEEQVANQLAMAVVEHRLAPSERERAGALIKRAMDGLAAKLGLEDVAVDSFQSFWEALAVGGQIRDRQLRYLELTKQFFGTDMVDMLESSGQLSEEILRRLERRESTIQEINLQYSADYLRYMYYQLGWMYLELASPDREYAEEFAREELHLAERMLPPVAAEPLPDEGAILACFKAYQDALPYSEPGSRYFYKRYRALLLARLRATVPAEQFGSSATFIYQTWEGEEGKDDMLALVSHLAPPGLRGLFPHQIVGHSELQQISPQAFLPSETDRRLWQHIRLGEEDREASNLLARLALLEQLQIFRMLPAEAMLALCHNLYRVKLAPGEAIIWEGERDKDVYVLIQGRLSAFRTENAVEEAIGTIKPGEVFGEMAFLTAEPRSATVRAVEPSECFVLKDTDLHILAYKYPVIFVEITRILSKRLAQMIDMV